MNLTSDPIRVGLLGTAHTAHAASYLAALAKIPGAALSGIYDDEAQRGEQFAAQFQTPYYPVLDDLLSQADLQGVIVCSETARHKDLVCAAARRGKHVLCEKPIAASRADAREMIAACRAAGVLLQTAFVCRFMPTVQAARRQVQAGEAGRVLGIVGGNRGIPPLPPVYPDWITDPVLAGGGALLDHSVHVTDAMRFILGSEVESVYAQAGVFRQPNLQVEDCALLSLNFQGGVVATVDPSWSLPANNPFQYDFYLRILCEKGTIHLDDTRQALEVVSDLPQARAVTAEPFGMDIDMQMVQHFVGCIRAGQNLFPAASGEDGLRALEIALAAYDSTRSCQPETVLSPEEEA